LADLGIEIVSGAVFIQGFGFVDHAKLDGHHRQLRLDFGLFLGLPDAPCASCEFHVTNANLSHVKSFAFDAHDCHFLPNRRILDIFDTFVSLV
jgi:hypothetical protein